MNTNDDDNAHNDPATPDADDLHANVTDTTTPQPPSPASGGAFTELTALASSYLSRSTNAAPAAASNAAAAGLTVPVSPPTSRIEAGPAELLIDVDMVDSEDCPTPPIPPSSSGYSTVSANSVPASPASTSLRASRRARVEDDVAEEDTRETNRQRLQSPQAGPAPPLPPDVSPNPADAAHPRNDTGPHRFVFDFILGPPLGGGTPHAQHDHQHGAPNSQLGQGSPHIVNMGQFFNQMRGQPGFFDMLFGGLGSNGEEPDDPERARRLLNGLEDVPPGLVKRLQKVGGNTEADAGPGCAVCWESLLDGDGGFGDHEQTGEGGESASSAHEDHPTPSTSTPLDNEKKHPKVVALPCSHVFHESCLLPWFTRAHRTTCPSCRFDIDPDSLTYVPRPIRPVRSMPRRNRQQQGQGQTPAHAAPSSGQPPQIAADATAPPSDNAAARRPQDDMDYDYFVVDLGSLGNEGDVDNTHADAPQHDDPLPPLPPPQPAPHNDHAQAGGDNAQGPGPAPPPYGFVGFDVSMAFSFMEPPHVNGPVGPGQNAGATHFHLPYVFGGSFAVPSPHSQSTNTYGQQPIYGRAPSTTAHNVHAQPTGAQAPPQPADADPREFLQQIFNGFFGQAPAQTPRNNNALPVNPPAAPPTTASSAAAQAPSFPQRPFPTPVGTAARGMVPPPPTFAQFFQQLFPGIQIPQARTGAAQQPQPAPQAANPEPQPQDANPPLNTNRTLGNLTPEERRAMGSLFASLIPGVHFTPTTGQSGDGAPNPDATPNTHPLPGGGVPLFAFGPPPTVLPAADHNDDRRPSMNPFDFFSIAPIPMPGRQTPNTSRRPRASSTPFNPSTAAETNAPPSKPQWVLPPPPGPTLRQRVEKREQEMGLRCSDVSCGLGPTDDDPELTSGVDIAKVRQVGIHKLGSSGEEACEHRFHLACLVSAERVAGWGGDEVKNEDESKSEVEVSCPVCRAVGCVTREAWDEGVAALA